MTRFFSRRSLQRASSQCGVAIIEEILLLTLIAALCAAGTLRLAGKEVSLTFTCLPKRVKYAMIMGGGSSSTEDAPEARGPGPCGFPDPD